MDLLTLNIGLNNNPKKETVISSLFDYWIRAEESKSRTEVGVYKGVEEKTLVYKAKTDTNIQTIVHLVEDLCRETNQESIALTYKEYKLLVFNPNYKGKVFNFNDTLFIP